MKSPRVRRTQVEWVDLYTRQTLLWLMWLTLGFILVGAAPVAEANPPAMLTLVVIALVLGVTGTYAQRAVADAWPGAQPTPGRPVLVMLGVAAACTAAAAVLPADPRLAGLSLVWIGTVYALAGLRDRRHLVALLVVLSAGAYVATGSPGTLALSVGAGLFLGFTVHISLWMLDVVRRLDRSRDTEAALAVAEERLRFSRDVHDVLGRHLSTIAVRAELAAALARRGDPSAADTMLEVRTTAHDALREARELARGYRASSLERELEGASSLLAAAGIETVVSVADLPARWHEPAAWVVREAVTNVLRHSAATKVEIAWRDGVLSVANDGSGEQQRSGNGLGIVGLGERLAPLGSVVSTTLRDGRWTLAATMPDDLRAPTVAAKAHA
ncbi:sensor histidine kinase [Nocardioides currus]|uniref:Histidine kinase n=1 Tax=Nocardioides currus TaxID=2133958 RepID=A0A2R7YYS7_9ACTN|nr:histidine kinase [Nocardioides currus]PUA81186.1 histidine kinase [Nocardioides currus]